MASLAAGGYRTHMTAMNVRKPPDPQRPRADAAGMTLDHDACYRAICARDARFDGRLYIGVRTTGIYCRPICPARTPLSRNITFYPTAAAAQEAGFRPCLRCRPETAPDLAAWRGTSNTVRLPPGLALASVTFAACSNSTWARRPSP